MLAHFTPVRQRQPHRRLVSMYILRFHENVSDPSLVQIARRCAKACETESSTLEAVFVGLSDVAFAHLMEWRAHHNLHSLGDWARTLDTLLAPGSDYCPHCGLATFADPDVIAIYCSACGENPGTVFERAGGPFFP